MGNETFDTKILFNEKMRITYLLSTAISLIILDEIFDQLDGSSMREVILDIVFEVPTFAILLYTLHYVWNRLMSETKNKEQLKNDLVAIKDEALKWEQKSVNFPLYFDHLIDTEFNKWGLSKSETDIARMLIMGKSGSDIAVARFTSERTIRNQCHAIYEKSQCKGRNEFYGHFMQKILSSGPTNQVFQESLSKS